MTELTHGDGQDLLAAWKAGWEARNPDLILDLFDKDADYRPAPFSEPLAGVIAIRRAWNEIAASQANVDFDAENIWVSGHTVLASWHAAYTVMATGERVRVYGFVTMELNDAGLITRLRQWPVERAVGRDATYKIERGEQ